MNPPNPHLNAMSVLRALTAAEVRYRQLADRQTVALIRAGVPLAWIARARGVQLRTLKHQYHRLIAEVNTQKGHPEDGKDK